ncbi:MAG: aminomethyltransferase family protein [Pseudomonadota bacterium]|nr:aminomethyltransferase family protein [Pseudomonadota bacterium]
MARESILNLRHRELGSTFNGIAWNNYLTPWDYSTNPNDEVIAVRTSAGVYDVTMLNVMRVSGDDATSVCDYLVSRDIAGSQKGQAMLCNIVDPESGYICDDIVIFNDGDNHYRVVTGSGDTHKYLHQASSGKKISLKEDFDVHMISVQGPKALSLLSPHVTGDLSALKWFQHMDTSIFGCKVNIARVGYSGERGYEVYCESKDAVYLWDTILEIGKQYNVMACSWNSLDLVRVETGLMFYPYEMPGGKTIWECNMGWAIAKNKGSWMGKEKVMDQQGKERSKCAGIIAHWHEAIETGAKLYAEGKEVGIVTSPSYSRYLMKSLALVHLIPEYAKLGTNLEIRGPNITCKAVVESAPFYDPMKLRLRPEQIKK